MVEDRWVQLFGVRLHIPDNSVCRVTLRELFSCQTGVAGSCLGETALLDFVLKLVKYFSTFLFLIIQIVPLVLQQTSADGCTGREKSHVAAHLRFQNIILSSSREGGKWEILKFLMGKKKFNYDIGWLLSHNVKYSHFISIIFAHKTSKIQYNLA